MKKLKAAVVGLGMGLGFHTKMLAEHPNFELVALCDVNQEKLNAACEKYGVRGYTDYNTLIEESGIDLVVIASPTHFHRDHSIFAMEHGIDVFLEKPMANNEQDAQDIAACMQRTGRKLMIYQPHRTMPDHRAVAAAIDSGLMGRIFTIKRRNACYFARDSWQAYRKNGGGTLYNRGSHYFDECIKLSGGKPVKANCILTRALAYGDADDSFKAIVRTDNGVVLDIEMIMAAAYNCVQWEIFGDLGTAVQTRDAQGRDVIRVRYYSEPVSQRPIQQYVPIANVSDESGDGPWKVKDFYLDDYPRLNIYDLCYDYYALGKEPFVPVSDTLTVMKTLDACLADAGDVIYVNDVNL